VALAALVLCLPTAGAQEAEPLPDFALERLELNPGRGALLVSGGALLAPGDLRVSVVGHYQRDPLVTFREGQRLALVRDRLTGVLAAAYGVLPRLELGAQLPVVTLQEGADNSGQGLAAAARSGWGSPRLQGRVGLLSQASESEDAVDLAVELELGLPVGSSRALAREAGTSLLGQVMVGGSWGPVAPALEVGVLLRPSVSLGPSTGSRDEVGSELRLGAGLSTVGHVLRGELGLRAAFSQGRTHSTLEVLSGARYAPVPMMEVFALGGVGFGSEPGTPLYRLVFGMAFNTAPPAEKVTEPEVVYELVTLTPRKSSAPRVDEALAPPVPGPAPEPSTPEPVGSSGNERPALEPDTDGDGVVDVLDACVRERGVPEAQGCALSTPQLVTLTRERLVLNGQIFFETGSATMPESSRVLDRAAQVLLEHPEISLVTIEGHTDAVGGPVYNQALSRARAEAVRRYLIERGVPAERLVARGFGPARPADTNATAQGREKNRRVEVLLMLGPPTPVVTDAPPP
jgi:outer membrane protein OmpA-like peptidoglycan-associated protein